MFIVELYPWLHPETVGHVPQLAVNGAVLQDMRNSDNSHMGSVNCLWSCALRVDSMAQVLAAIICLVGDSWNFCVDSV